MDGLCRRSFGRGMRLFPFSTLLHHHQPSQTQPNPTHPRPLTLTAALAGLVAMGASRYGQDKPLVSAGLLASKRAQGPALLTLALGVYTVLALGAVTDARGGLTLWLNLTGAATIVGALSFYNNGGRMRQSTAT